MMECRSGKRLAIAALFIFLVFWAPFSAGIVRVYAANDALVKYRTSDDFTIIILPDTQGYSWSYPAVFNSQTRWIVNNVDALNIVFVSHEGDVVEMDEWYQWQNANQSMSLLDGNVPWGILPGNHDVDVSGAGFSSFNRFFGAGRFSGESWYGGNYYGNNANNYELFSGGGDEYLIFHLQYNPTYEILAWANNVISSYPDKKVIVTTHDFLDTKGVRTISGDLVWNEFVRLHADQISLVLCGHARDCIRRSDVVSGHVVHQLLANYQDLEMGGNGYLRILKFSPSQDRIYVSTYSPYLNKYMTDGINQFFLDYPMTQEYFSLEVNVVGSGSTTVSPAKDTYVFGSVVNFTVSPDPGWSFDSWSGDLSDAADSPSVTMYADMNVTATFTQDQYNLDISIIGSGSVNKSPAQNTYIYGDVVNLTATPNPGWSFDGWNGDLSSRANLTEITMYGDRSVVATFTQNHYFLEVSIVGSGSVSKNPVQETYVYGDVVNLTAARDLGWDFGGWSGDLSSSDNPVSFIMDGEKMITLTFIEKQYSLPVRIVGTVFGYVFWECILSVMIAEFLFGFLLM